MCQLVTPRDPGPSPARFLSSRFVKFRDRHVQATPEQQQRLRHSASTNIVDSPTRGTPSAVFSVGAYQRTIHNDFGRWLVKRIRIGILSGVLLDHAAVTRVYYSCR